MDDRRVITQTQTLSQGPQSRSVLIPDRWQCEWAEFSASKPQDSTFFIRPSPPPVNHLPTPLLVFLFTFCRLPSSSSPSSSSPPLLLLRSWHCKLKVMIRTEQLDKNSTGAETVRPSAHLVCSGSLSGSFCQSDFWNALFLVPLSARSSYRSSSSLSCVSFVQFRWNVACCRFYFQWIFCFSVLNSCAMFIILCQ